MSEKPDTDRRDFLRSLLPDVQSDAQQEETRGSDDSPETQTDRRGFVTGLAALGLGLLSSGEIMAQTRTNRFKLMELIDPVSANFAPGQNPYTIVPQNAQPHLWPADDVSRKDRDKLKFDIPSPSISFEAMKRLQSSVKSRFELIEDRLKVLDKIRRDSNNFEHAIDPDHPLHQRHKKLKEVYDREYPVNSELSRLWGAINIGMEPLRQAVKATVIMEMRACQGLKRCTVKHDDIQPDDLLLQVAVLPTKPNSDFKTYADVRLPREFRLEGYRCANIPDDAGNQAKVTNSVILENIKFFERAATDQIAAVDHREERYLQIERIVEGIKGSSALKAQLISIYKRERTHNEKTRASWNRIKVVVVMLKRLIAAAEAKEASAAEAIDRCETT